MTSRRTFMQIGAMAGAVQLGGTASAAETVASTLEKNKALVRSYFDRCWNKGDLDYAATIMIPNYDLHLNDGPGGYATWRAGVASMRKIFPDIRFDNLQLIAEGDMVAVRSVFYATHTVEYMGIPATGRKLAIRCADYYRVRDGKLVAHWDVPDFFSLLQQIGGLSAGLSLGPGVRREWPADAV